jgi:hypothetical protein
VRGATPFSKRDVNIFVCSFKNWKPKVFNWAGPNTPLINLFDKENIKSSSKRSGKKWQRTPQKINKTK